MSWEFRKVRPGQNVAVEAQRDPFAGPKWAPPIWHMPQGLVLLVALLRLLVRVVWFCLRHPFAVAVTAGSIWLGGRYGWPLPVALAGLVGAVLALWVVLDRGSFSRWVGGPTRSRFRLMRVYRRRWHSVMTTAGLSKTSKGREFLPRIRRVVSGPTADWVLVKMLTGQAPSAWEKATDNLAHGFGAALCRVRNGPKPGFVWVELVRHDTLADPIPALPIPDTLAAVNL